MISLWFSHIFPNLYILRSGISHVFPMGKPDAFPLPSMISGEKYLGRYGNGASTARKRHQNHRNIMGNARKILGNYWKTIGFKSWTTIDEMGKGKLWETMKNPRKMDVLMGNHGKTMGNPWTKWRLNIVKPWEKSHRKKIWDILYKCWSLTGKFRTKFVGIQSLYMVVS